jgi:uncharacterized protein YyaL (SSP411 family)
MRHFEKMLYGNVQLEASSLEGARVQPLQDRSLEDGQAAAYVCRDFACQTPVADPEGLQSLLETH